MVMKPDYGYGADSATMERARKEYAEKATLLCQAMQTLIDCAMENRDQQAVYHFVGKQRALYHSIRKCEMGVSQF